MTCMGLPERAISIRAPWGVPGAVGLILDNVRPLPFVPCKGALGFFRVPDDVRAALALGDAQ